MDLTNQKSEQLHEEARQLYERYGQLKTKMRADRSRHDLKNELQAVQERYTDIVKELRQRGAASKEENAQIANFEVGHYRAHKPVVSHTDYGDGHIDRIFTLLKPRTLISLILLIFCGLTLILMSDKTIGFFIVPTSSMEPTFIPNDKLVTFRKTEYQRGDIVVLHDPVEKGAFLVKRLVAVGNDDIYIHKGQIMVNSKPIQEPYIRERIDYEFGPYRVPQGHIFVLGDNRNESEDAHKWGHGIPETTIVGKVLYIYAPRARARSIPSGSNQFTAAGL